MRADGTVGSRYLFPEPGERKANGPADEPHIRRNFLTWAFFLAQASAAELLLTGGAKAQAGELSENPLTRSDPQLNGLPNDAMQRKVDVAEAPVIASTSNSNITPNVAPTTETADLTHSLPLSGIAGDAPPAGAAAGDSAGASAVGSASPSPIGSGGSTNNSLPELLPDIGGTGLTPTPPPITVDIGLTPLPGFDVTIDIGGLINANIGLDLNGLLDPLQALLDPLQDVTNLLVSPLQDVTGLVGSLTDDLGHLLNGDGLGLGGLLQSSQLSALTGLTLTDGIAGLLDGDGASAGALADLDDAHQPVVALVTSVTDAATQTLLGGGGVINILGGLTGAAAQSDDLYAHGRYTDYNVALRDNANSHRGDATADIAAVSDTPTPADHQPPTDPAIADLPSLDDLFTRLTI